ncbi:MAG: hypothetical protein ACRDJC_24230 [Thermomicrobiales bacterium]
MPSPQWLSIIPDVATVIAVLVAAAGLLYTGKQLELTRKATAAQLLLHVDESLREFDETIFRLRDGSVRGDEFEVQRLMGAMERLHVLVTNGLIDPGDIDDLHGWRLEALLRNEKVRSYITEYPNEWRRLTDLHQRLAEHRTRAARPMDQPPRRS